MPRATDSRSRMLRGAARLLRRQGYAATGWRQVVAEGEAPWGSQAHHFPGGKAQLAAEAIERTGASYERLLQAALAGAPHPAEAIGAWARGAAAELAASGWADGCPVATVALETAHTSDQLAAACSRAFASWHTALADAMTGRGMDPDEAAALAMLVLAAIEGALVLARAHRDPAPLEQVGRQLEHLVADRVP